MTTNNIISSMKCCYNTRFILPNNPKDLDLFYKMDLDSWDGLEGKITLSYNRKNIVGVVLEGRNLCFITKRILCRKALGIQRV